jgi:hypothetical protein
VAQAPRAHAPRQWGGPRVVYLDRALRDVVCNSNLTAGGKTRPHRAPEGPREDKPRIPYPTGADFEEGTREALRMAEELGEFHLYGRLLGMLADCKPMEHYAPQEQRGASYKQLAAIGHVARMSGPERAGWYRCAESVPLSDRHAAHILSKLKGTSR